MGEDFVEVGTLEGYEEAPAGSMGVTVLRRWDQDL